MPKTVGTHGTRDVKDDYLHNAEIRVIIFL